MQTACVTCVQTLKATVMNKNGTKMAQR